MKTRHQLSTGKKNSLIGDVSEYINKNFIHIPLFILLAIDTFLMGFKDQHFIFLSRAFLHGKYYFLDNPFIWNQTDSDIVFFDNHYFWPLGPLPALLISPFVFLADLFHISIVQGYFSFFIAVAVFFFCRKLAKHFDYNGDDANWWAASFCAGSVFMSIALISTSWYFSQEITVLLLLMLLAESLMKKRILILGLITGAIMLTRASAGIGALFYILLMIIYYEIGNLKNKTFKVGYFMVPIIGSCILLLAYNYLRFNNLLEFGYKYQIQYSPDLINAREKGLFSIAHIPGNLYYLLLAGPLPVIRDGISQVLKFPYIKNNPWGMSIFLTSPYLIYLFFIDKRDKLITILLSASAITLLLVSLYYGIGYEQFGFRYSLDFFPYLFLILLMGYKKNHLVLSIRMKIVISSAITFNMYLLLTRFL